MTFVVSLEGFVPGRRFDGQQWTEGRIEYGGLDGSAWAPIETQPLVPLDTDPADPQPRNFTTALAPSETGYFRVVFIDGGGREQESAPVYTTPVAYEARGETVEELVDQVRTEGSFDLTVEAVLRSFNQQHRRMVAESRCYRQEVSIGPTVDDQAVYLLDPDIIEVTELMVDGVPWKRTGTRSLAGLRGQLLRTCGVGGVYAQWPSPAGAEQVMLYPVPVGGLAVTGVAAMRAPDLVLTDRPMVPPEFHEALVGATIGALIGRVDEGLGAAQTYKDQFEVDIEKLRRTVKARFSSGPGQIAVVGYHL